MSQTAYSADQGLALPGMVADGGPSQTVSAIASGALAAGNGVSFSAASSAAGVTDICKAPAAGTDVTNAAKFLGIAIYNAGREPHTSAAEYADESVVSILRKGRIWVEVEDAVAVGGGVFCRHVAAGAEVLGAFRSDADGSDASQVAHAVFLTAASASGLALVELA